MGISDSGLRAKKLRTLDLDEGQTLEAIDAADKKGVMGALVHDWLHVRAAKLGGADLRLNWDGGLSDLCAGEGLKAERP